MNSRPDPTRTPFAAQPGLTLLPEPCNRPRELATGAPRHRRQRSHRWRAQTDTENRASVGRAATTPNAAGATFSKFVCICRRLLVLVRSSACRLA